MGNSRRSEGTTPRNTAALRFAREIVERRGIVDQGAVEAVRQAGFSDGEIAEIMVHVALNILTNYFNNVAGVDVDFPRVTLAK